MEGKKVIIDSKLEVVLPHGVVSKEDEVSTREKIMPQVWMSCANDEFGWSHLIQTKRDFSYATAEPWTGLAAGLREKELKSLVVDLTFWKMITMNRILDHVREGLSVAVLVQGAKWDEGRRPLLHNIKGKVEENKLRC